MILSTMNSETCAALAEVMPVLLVALIAERVAFKQGKNKRKMRYKLAVALTRTFVDFVLALIIIALELGFLDGVDLGGYKGSSARGFWSFTVFILIAVLYRWFLLSTSVQFAFTALTDWMIRVIARPLGWVLTRLPESLAEGLVAVISGLAEVLLNGVLSIGRLSRRHDN